MAKTKGTVGRTGRATDDPPIVDAPRGVRVRRGKGGGKTTGIVIGIPVKRQPRPDLTWHDDDSGREHVKVSERTKYPQQGKYADNYKKAVENIDKVHTVQKRMNPVQVATVNSPGAGYYGLHSYEAFVEEPSEENNQTAKIREYSHIDINTGSTGSDAKSRSTLYHEYGHAYDSQAVNYRDEQTIPNRAENMDFHRRRFQSENAFRRVEQSGDTTPRRGDSPWDRWAKAVINSKSYQRLKKKEKSASGYYKADLEYYLSPREIFARSYQQYIGLKVDPESMKATRKDHRAISKRTEGNLSNPYWEGHDFDAVGSAVEDILGSRGELVESKTTTGRLQTRTRIGSVRKITEIK